MVYKVYEFRYEDLQGMEEGEINWEDFTIAQRGRFLGEFDKEGALKIYDSNKSPYSVCYCFWDGKQWKGSWELI